MLNFGGVFLSLKKNASPPKPNTSQHQPTTAKPPGCEDTQEPVALLRSRLLEANIPEVLSAMEVKTRPISTQALFRGADYLGCHVVFSGWKSWNLWNEGWCVFFWLWPWDFFLEMKTIVWLQRKETNTCVFWQSCQLLNTRCFHHQLVGFTVVSEKPAPGFTAFWRGWNAAG